MPLADSPFFVIEADEYDTAFFDKRSKFVHYRSRTVVLNNLEYDHADIFPSIETIETQFHHLVRTVPANGLIVANGTEPHLANALDKGSWTPIEHFGPGMQWDFRRGQEENQFEVRCDEKNRGIVTWDLTGTHNKMNALAAIAAARHAGVPVKISIEALNQFNGVARRMEVRGVVHGITVYDDFAHHPTAIATTLAGLRRHVGQARIIAVLEPRSNTMKLGSMRNALPGSLANADVVIIHAHNLGWDAAETFAPIGTKTGVFDNLANLVEAVAAVAQPNDHIVVMSNGGFGGVHTKILRALEAKAVVKIQST
jgi:UDP-N-acetylmuramate: L-alanyl-gamma-D-glutamyl-meso-diaminopimelate ligase